MWHLHHKGEKAKTSMIGGSRALRAPGAIRPAGQLQSHPMSSSSDSPRDPAIDPDAATPDLFLDEHTRVPLRIEDWLTVISMALLALIMRKG